MLNVSFTGELWRNNPIQQALNVGYIIDPSGSSTFPSNAVFNGLLTPISGLTLAFSTTTNTVINDGTLTINQTNLSVSGFTISDWTPGSTLWLVWQTSTSVGGAQNVAIDNLSLSATPIPVVVNQPINLDSTTTYTPGGAGAGLHLGFANTPGGDWLFTVWGTTNLSQPFSQWQNLGHPTEVSSGQYQFNDAQATNKPQRFYRISNP